MSNSIRARWLWGALLIAVMACAAITAISLYTARELLNHRSARPAVTPADSGLAYSVVPLRARDGTVLEGWWIRPRDGARRRDLATVVLAHAADGERPGALTGKAGMLRHAAWLSRAGFIVLAFDFRSYGGSSGTQTTGGYLEQQDLEAAIRLAHERAVGAPVAILGEGMGATVGLAVMARDTSLVALVADSPGTSWRDGLPRVNRPWWARVSVPAIERMGQSGLMLRTFDKARSNSELHQRSVLLISERDASGPEYSRRASAFLQIAIDPEVSHELGSSARGTH